ncbi:MAG TPA: hypothetical protein VGD06_07320 [Acidobacteriota bacterium]
MSTMHIDDGDGKATDRVAGEASRPVARTRHTELTLDQIGALMPGLGSLMPIIADRFGWAYHAAKGGNWGLARYQLRKVRKLLGVGKVTRPKWTPTIDAYDAAFLQPMADAIEIGDWQAFDAAAQAAVNDANRIHAETGFGYIVYRIPEKGPAHMSTEPGDAS